MIFLVDSFDDIIGAIEGFQDADWSTIADEVKMAYKDEVFRANAIRTGAFIRSINWHAVEESPDLHEYLVDTSDDPIVTYDGFVDQGTRYIVPRYMARKAIENLQLVDTVDAIVDGVFQKVEVTA